MKYTTEKLLNKILVHKGRVDMFYQNNMPHGIIQQELDIIDTLEAVLLAKQKFLYRCMGINFW